MSDIIEILNWAKKPVHHLELLHYLDLCRKHCVLSKSWSMEALRSAEHLSDFDRERIAAVDEQLAELMIVVRNIRRDIE